MRRNVRPTLGNPHEMSVLEIARMVIEISSSESVFIYEGLPEDDPKRRCPQIRRAKETLSWEPCIGAREGLHKTLSWFFRQLTDRQGLQADAEGSVPLRAHRGCGYEPYLQNASFHLRWKRILCLT
jgi:hypothetical protein